MPAWLTILFLLAVGGCIGSFLNVVILRLPEGKSLVNPGSACPKCGHALAWFENVPVLSWLALRGRCRSCKTPISAQYPIIEALTAVLFAGLFGWYYLTAARPDLSGPGLAATWPVLVMHLALIAAGLAATVIDLRFYIIPLPIPWTITAAALIGYPLAAAFGLWPPEVVRADLLERAVPAVGPSGFGAAVGGAGGLALALALMWFGPLPRSFDEAELEEDLPDEAGELPAHPHPRREALKELAFVAFPAAGLVFGAWVMSNAAEAALPGGLAFPVLGGVLLGYLVGGGVVWATRVLGTLAFGKEAMGLGDVHLLAALGAVLGPVDSIFVFFIAPFVGLGATLVTMLAQMFKQSVPRVIPFGPSLAVAALILMLFRQPIIEAFWAGLLPPAR